MCLPLTLSSPCIKAFLITLFLFLQRIQTSASTSLLLPDRPGDSASLLLPWSGWPWLACSYVTFQSPPYLPINLSHFQLYVCSLPHFLCFINLISFLIPFSPFQSTTFICPNLGLLNNYQKPNPLLPLNLNLPNLILDVAACLEHEWGRASIFLSSCVQLMFMKKS